MNERRRPRRQQPSTIPLHAPAARPPATLITIKDALGAAGVRPSVDAKATEKKNYAERFSRAVAQCIANRLRQTLPGTKPDEEGRGQESLARTPKGFKKLDVNYSTPELGLGLGVSVKSINFPDHGRFTKNYSRNDNELRAEATDYHRRQPFSVLAGVLFLPDSAYRDARSRTAKGEEPGISSFGAAVRFFRPRAGRRSPRNDVDLFERFFVGMYNEDTGETCFFAVMKKPPRARALRKDECASFDEFIQEIIKTYNERNNPPFEWAQ